MDPLEVVLVLSVMLMATVVPLPADNKEPNAPSQVLAAKLMVPVKTTFFQDVVAVIPVLANAK